MKQKDVSCLTNTCRQWILIMALPPVTESLATFFNTSSISGTISFLDKIAWRRQTCV